MSSTVRYDVMVAGHLCLDITPRFLCGPQRTLGELLLPGKLVEVGAVELSTGGAVSNTGIALRRLGNRVCSSARLGDDAFGRVTMDVLARYGAATGVRVVRGSASSYTIVLAPPGIDRIFLHQPGTNDSYGPEDVDAALLRACRWFHMGYPPLMRRMYVRNGADLVELMTQAKRAGATTSCDMALPDPSSDAGKAPWRTILSKTLPVVDVFLPSVDEALYALHPRQYLTLRARFPHGPLSDALSAEQVASLAEELLDMGTPVVGLKAGGRGWYLRTARRPNRSTMGRAAPADVTLWACRELWAPAWRVRRVVSATGAGDASIAGFVTAFLKGLSPELCLRAATCLGWQNVQTLDAVSGIRSWPATLRLVAGRPSVLPVRGLPGGWRWNAAQGLWVGPGDSGRT